MKNLLSMTALIAILGALPGTADAKRKHVLFFTKSSGFQHDIVKQKDGQPSFVEPVMQKLAADNGFDLTHTKDGSVFTEAGMKPFDAFVFLTVGDLDKSGTDGFPPMPEGGKDALLAAIARGKGFVGIHGASSTFHTPGERAVDNGDNADPYIKMLGGEFIGHGPEQTGVVRCVNPRFPGLQWCKDDFELFDEWYSLKNMPKDLHVLMVVNTWSLDNTGKSIHYRRPSFPVAWARMYGKGRVYFTALGHAENVWNNPNFQAMVVGGIHWATGSKKATIPPNIARVAPGYDHLPPAREKAK